MAAVDSVYVRLEGDAYGLRKAVSSAEKEMSSLARHTLQTSKGAGDAVARLRDEFGLFIDTGGRVKHVTGEMAKLSQRAPALEALGISLKDVRQELRQLADTGTTAGSEMELFAKQIIAADRAGQLSANGLSKTTSLKRLFANEARNASFQINDFAVQVASGTSASVALSQQLPQVIQGFGTLGAVASALAAIAIPAFAFALSNAEGAAVSFEDALESLTTIQSGLDGATEILTMNIEELTEKYGTAAHVVRQFAIAQAEAMVAQARSRLGEQLQDISRAISDYSTSVDGTFLPAQRNLAAELGISRTEAFELAQALGDLNAAPTFETQQEALQKVDALMQQFGINAEQLPPVLRNALIELRNMAIAANELEATTSRTLEAARSGIPETPADEETGGGRRGLTPEEENARQMERLQQQLMTEEEAIYDSYARRQEILNQFLQMNADQQAQYNDLSLRNQQAYQDAMERLDRAKYNSQLGYAAGFFGSMATLFENGSGELLRVAKIFGAAEALINAWRAFNQVMADPLLPWFAKAGAAAGVLSAGLQAVSAIKGVSPGGSSTAVAPSASSSAPSAVATPTATAAGPTNVAIQLTGGDMFSRDQVLNLINAINESVEDGARIRVV